MNKIKKNKKKEQIKGVTYNIGIIIYTKKLKNLSLMMALIERYPSTWHMLIERVRSLMERGSGVQVSKDKLATLK